MMSSLKQHNYSSQAKLWVLSLYFIEGLPFSLVNTVSTVLFKTLQISNTEIGFYTSLFYLPWAAKFIWAPVVDYTGQRRGWIITTQIILAIVSLILSLCILFSQSFVLLCALFFLMAFTSATYDVACDGFYLDKLDKAEQSLYIGWRNSAYKLAWLFAAGFLVYAVGEIATNRFASNFAHNNIAWCFSFAFTAFIFGTAALLHIFILPSEITTNKENNKLLLTFGNAFFSFFQQPKILLILLWILLFRAGDAMLLKMAQPFLLDESVKGGLGLSLQTVGIIYGTLGITCLLLGGISGGWLVFKYGLKKCLLPFALLQSITLLLYWALATFKPELSLVISANAFEQFVYGLATAAYTSYLFTIVKDKFLASHYAIATGFMALGMILPGAVSGWLVDLFGYKLFFLISFAGSIPGIICTFNLPFTEK